MSKKTNIKTVGVSWGEASSQNNMTDPQSDYNHITIDGNHKESADKGDHVVMYRGKHNHAPQKDIELGRKSITHKTIADKMAKLVCGKGLGFKIKDPENEGGDLTAMEEAFIEEANELLTKGLSDSFKRIINGIVYHNLANVITTQNRAQYSESKDAVYPVVEWMTSQPSERMRWSEPIMGDNAEETIPYHYYHKNWGFEGKCLKSNHKVKVPEIIPIKDYIKLSKEGSRPKEAFYVHTPDSPTAKKEQHLSFAFSADEGIFDGAYPIPRWKANSSINDIQNEFEASCIRTDFLRNGLHVFAIVNVYSTKFNVTTENDEETSLEDWADSLDVVKALKKSHNSGKVIVNALGTNDPTMDGKTEVENIDVSFPADTYKALTEQSTNGVLTAWGVVPDLFGITKPEGSNLRSQEGFMKVGVLMLKEDVSLYQNIIASGINRILRFYGMTEVSAYIEPNESSLYLSIMADIAKEYMRINEVREKILGVEKWNEQELAIFIEEKMKFGSSKKKDTTESPKEDDDE